MPQALKRMECRSGAARIAEQNVRPPRPPPPSHMYTRSMFSSLTYCCVRTRILLSFGLQGRGWKTCWRSPTLLILLEAVARSVAELTSTRSWLGFHPRRRRLLRRQRRQRRHPREGTGEGGGGVIVVRARSLQCMFMGLRIRTRPGEGGATHLLPALSHLTIILTTHSFRDGAPFLLLIDKPPTFWALKTFLPCIT